MKVGVLGANGFIGSRVVEMFHLGGLADVRPIVRSVPSLARASRFALDTRIADAFDRAALRKALEGCDAVIHAIAGDRRTILGTLKPVYDAARTAGVRRLIYLSSASVHGQAPPAGTHEESPLSDRQAFAYNNSKVRAEWMLRRLRSSGPVEVVRLRPGIVYGPRSQWTGGLADELLAGAACLIEGGEGICNGTYVDNLVHAIYLATKAAGADGQAFLIGDLETITWRDFYRPIAEALGMDLTQVRRVTSRGLEPGDPEAGQLVRIRGALSLLPGSVGSALRAIHAAWQAQRSSSSPWTRPVPPELPVTMEKALLHQCRFKLPSTKAAKTLGYAPPVSFDEACRRSVGWLAFCGYPVVVRA